MVTDLPDYEKKIIIVTPPGEYPAVVQVDLRKILGEDLITPTVAGCVPTSIENEAIAYDEANDWFKAYIENDAIAYDSVNDRFKVDIEALTLGALTVIQPDETLLKATVLATDLDIRNLVSTIDSVEVKQATAANLKATVEALNLDIRDLTSVSDSVEVKQATASNLNANVFTKHDNKTYKTAVFDASASGNLVAAVAGKVIKLHALTIQAQGTVVVNLNNGSGGSSLMEWSFQAREGAVIPMATAPAYWAITSVNTALYVTLSAAVTVTITAIYSDDDES